MIQWPGFHPTGTQGHNDQVIKKNVSNDQASIQQEHKATTNNVIKKKDVSNDQAFIQQGHKATTTKWLRKNVSNDQVGIQQEHKATTTNLIKKNIIQWPGKHPTRTKGHNNQCD